MKKLVALTGLLIAGLLSMTGCAAFNNDIEDIMRALGSVPGTVYNYGADGQVVFQAHCRSLDFAPDTAYDVYNGDGKMVDPTSVVLLSCGDNLISTVGFTTVYVSDDAQGALFANSQQFANLKIQNNDRGVPLVNYAWRSVKNNFVGTPRVAQICDQNNNPILAFAGSVTGFATDVAKSTMFQIDYKGKTGYVWISRGSYTVTDTALL